MRPSQIALTIIGMQLALLVSTPIAGQTASSNPKAGQAPEVKVNLIVTDGDNHSVDDIRKDDIKVFADNIEQPLLLLAKDDRPVDYAIVIDTSASLSSVMGAALEAVSLIIGNNRPSDQTWMVRFVDSQKIETLQDFTSDKGLLFAALKSIKIEGGQSAILYALYVSLEHTAQHAQNDRRQALVLITDGEDRQSVYRLEDVVKALHKSNIQVFIIGITFLLSKEAGLVTGLSPRDQAEKLLATIAEESRGRVFYTQNVGELAKAIIEINHDLHDQFLLTYQPTNNEKKGFRTVKVKIAEAPGRKKWKAIAPRAYYPNVPDANSKRENKKP